MTAHTPAKVPVLTSDTTFIAEPVHEETPRHLAYRYMMAATRLALGWVFLWAFLDKTFGLGHETPSDGAWINGGSPTEGFLANAPTGPVGLRPAFCGNTLAPTTNTLETSQLCRYLFRALVRGSSPNTVPPVLCVV